MMSTIFLNRSMPFYQFGDLIWLEKIPTSDWIDYIVDHFKASGMFISEDVAIKMCESVDNYPSYVQQLALTLLHRLEKGQTATADDVTAALRDIIQANEALYMQQVEPLTIYQMNLLRAIVSGIHYGFNEKSVRANFDLGSPSNIVRLRSSLTERDLIYSELKHLYITDPVFALWFKSRFV